MYPMLQAFLENPVIPSHQNITKLKLSFLIWPGTALVFSRLYSLPVKLAGLQWSQGSSPDWDLGLYLLTEKFQSLPRYKISYIFFQWFSCLDAANHLFFHVQACKAMPITKLARNNKICILKLIKQNGLNFKGPIQSKICWIIRHMLVSMSSDAITLKQESWPEGKGKTERIGIVQPGEKVST